MTEQATTALYAALCERFETTYQLKKGDTQLDYLTLEQVVSRLNATLGVDGWEFRITDKGHDDRHCWVQGQMTVLFGSHEITREQFGECSMNPGMAVGDARKGACSDALKKCASLFGVGLYLQSKEEHAHSAPAAEPTPIKRDRAYEEVWQDAPVDPAIGCADCGAAITPWKPKDKPEWSAQQVADYARKKHGRVLCWNCGRRNAG